MTDVQFFNRCKKEIVDYYNSQAESQDKNGKITVDDVFIVWACKSLQNWKALAGTTVPDGMYYEITYNGIKGEMYLDAYKKWKNMSIVI